MTYGETELLLIFDKISGSHDVREIDVMSSFGEQFFHNMAVLFRIHVIDVGLDNNRMVLFDSPIVDNVLLGIFQTFTNQ